MTTKQIRERLAGSFDTVSQKDGVVTVRRAFFYRFGGSTEKCVAAVKQAFPGCKVIDSGEKYVAFRGGATVAQGTHWWVKFRVEPTCIAPTAN